MVELKPEHVKLSFSGPRRAFYFLRKHQIKLFLKSFKVKEGVYDIFIPNTDVSYPKNIGLENVEPQKIQVELKLEKKKETENE